MNHFGKKLIAVLASLLAVVLLALTTAFNTMDRAELADRATPLARVELTSAPEFSLETVNADVLWLARCIYSETKRPTEQELVAWVIRNRVETRYRGQATYQGTVLDPFQFSAFNPGSSKRRHYVNLTETSSARGWNRALQIAHSVYYAPSHERPFPKQTRHFYSERSMRGGGTPDWARGKTPIRPAGLNIDARRFRFYAGIA